MTVPELIGTIPQWITASLMGTIVIAYWRRGVALKGLSNADAADIRGHLAKELERVIDRQRQCEEREALLRERLSAAEDEIRRMKDQLLSYGIDRVIMLGKRGVVDAPHSVAAAQRLKGGDK